MGGALGVQRIPPLLVGRDVTDTFNRTYGTVKRREGRARHRLN